MPKESPKKKAKTDEATPTAPTVTARSPPAVRRASRKAASAAVAAAQPIGLDLWQPDLGLRVAAAAGLPTRSCRQSVLGVLVVLISGEWALGALGFVWLV
jgi:hypothetical protein